MKDNSQIEPLAKATAVIMAQGGVAMWEARNTAKGVWEKEVGIDKNLTAMNRAGRRRGVTRSPRKERRRKPDDEVTPEYAERRHFQEDGSKMKADVRRGYTNCKHCRSGRSRERVKKRTVRQPD